MGEQTAIRLKARVIKPDPTPSFQCDAPYDESTYADHYRERRAKRMDRLGWSVTKCGRPAQYQIGGQRFCHQHTGIYLCEKLEAGKLVIHE
jgi:hypothetical protein